MNTFPASIWKKYIISASLVVTFFLSSSVQAQDNIRNSRPTLDVINDYTTNFSTDIRYIELNGITPGEEADQEVSIAVSTEDKDLIEYIGADLVGNGKAFINYRVKEGAAGTATVKVIVTDNGTSPSSFDRTFHITIDALNRELPALPLQEEANALKAFPNPAIQSSRITFSTPNDEPKVAVELYTLSGAKIKQLFTGSTRAHQPYYVDVNSKTLASGVYIVRLSGPSHTANLKLVFAK